MRTLLITTIESIKALLTIIYLENREKYKKALSTTNHLQFSPLNFQK